MNTRRRSLILIALAVIVVGIISVYFFTKKSSPQNTADLLIHGGPILTMEGDEPNYVEALVVQNGKIAFVGSYAEALSWQDDKTAVINLEGKTLMPGFIDGHAHMAIFGAQAIGANLLAPPDGDVNTIDDLVEKLKEFAKGSDIDKTGWIFGLGYDDALLGRHPTRHDLDLVSKDIPVIAVHISAHFSAMNSAGLALFGIGPNTPNPEGGIIRREADGKTPNGVLEELASIPYAAQALTPKTSEFADYFLKRGLEMAKSYGYTSINEGRLMGDQHLSLKDAASRGLIDIDVTGWQDYADKKYLDQDFSETYTNRYRLAGLKITLDGSPQGRTAWRTLPYLVPPDGQKKGYNGYPAIPDTKTIEAYLDEAYEKGWPVKLHANGDAAIDQLIEALRPVVAKHGAKQGQTILIHGQLIRKDQIPVLKELGIFPSMFPMHTFYWGDWYNTIIGPELADQISPMRSILNTGMIATSHTDAPVALPNLMQVAWATVNRQSRSGAIKGANERVTPYEAMKMITLWSAHQFKEEKLKGSLAVGKLADLVVLTDNPLTVDPLKINTIEVLETIKEGKSIWKR